MPYGVGPSILDPMPALTFGSLGESRSFGGRRAALGTEIRRARRERNPGLANKLSEQRAMDNINNKLGGGSAIGSADSDIRETRATDFLRRQQQASTARLLSDTPAPQANVAEPQPTLDRAGTTPSPTSAPVPSGTGSAVPAGPDPAGGDTAPAPGADPVASDTLDRAGLGEESPKPVTPPTETLEREGASITQAGAGTGFASNSDARERIQRERALYNEKNAAELDLTHFPKEEADSFFKEYGARHGEDKLADLMDARYLRMKERDAKRQEAYPGVTPQRIYKALGKTTDVAQRERMQASLQRMSEVTTSPSIWESPRDSKRKRVLATAEDILSR